MLRAFSAGCVLVVCAGLVGCGGSSHRAEPQPTIVVRISHPLGGPRVSLGVPKPPSPSTWPAYPHFSHHSCWTRPFIRGTVHSVYSVAPSYAPAPRSHPIPPATVASRLLARFGDHRYIRAITFAPAPLAVGSNVRVLYAGGHPPKDALTATVVSAGSQPSGHPTPSQSLATAIASYEAGLVDGALRDEMCAAGGAPLVSTKGADGGSFSDTGFALEQRFPNPSPAAFRRHVALVGRRYGFRIASLRLLRPLDLAPLLVVETSRSRKAFVHDMPAITNLLDPTTRAKHRTAETFEGFLLAAEDRSGPFAETESISRGESEGGEWSWNPCVYPYPTLGGPFGQKCPPTG
jgi:hypothetical protein